MVYQFFLLFSIDYWTYKIVENFNFLQLVKKINHFAKNEMVILKILQQILQEVITKKAAEDICMSHETNVRANKIERKFQKLAASLKIIILNLPPQKVGNSKIDFEVEEHLYFSTCDQYEIIRTY